MTVTESIRAHLLERAGVFEKTTMPSYEYLRDTQWSDHFERLMRNRLILGAFRYRRTGPLVSQGAIARNRIPRNILKRLVKYIETGNTEHLVDIANLCMVEFHCGEHPTKHFASIDDGVHV